MTPRTARTIFAVALAALGFAAVGAQTPTTPRLEISPFGYRITQIQSVPGIPRAFDITSMAGVCGDAATGVSSHLTSSSPNILVLDGLVHFGNVPRASCFRPISSRDTFTLRVILPPPGTLTWELVRTFLHSLSWRVTCDTCSANHPPVADAGPDQTAPVGQPIILDGTHSTDVDGDALAYAWTLASRPTGSAAELTTPSQSMAGLIPDVPGEYAVHLVVHDGHVASPADAVTISTINSRPVADAGADQTSLVGNTVHLDGSRSSDLDGHSLSFLWSLSSKPEGSVAALDDATGVRPAFIIDRPGTYVAQLIVNDGVTDSDADTVIVSTANSAPRADAGPAQSVHWNGVVFLDGNASTDADGDVLGYAWSMLSRPEGSLAALEGAGTSGPSFLTDRPGVYVVQLIVNDGTVDSAPATVAVTANNQAPVAVDDPARATVDTPVDLDVLANDSDGDGDLLEIASVSPPAHGTAALVSGRVRYTPSAGFSGMDSFFYTVTDGADSAAATVAVLVVPPPPGPIARLELSPSALLLTSLDEIRGLEVRAFDASGAPTFIGENELEFVSSNEEQIRAANGAVQALVIPGSALIRVRSIVEPSIVSPPVSVAAVQVKGAVFVMTDEEIVSEPVVIDVLDRRYEVRLTRPFDAGTLIVNSGGKAVMGRVASVDPMAADGTFRTEIRLAPLTEIFYYLTVSYSFTPEELSRLIRENVPLLAAVKNDAAVAAALENSRACRLDLNITEASADLTGNVEPDVGVELDLEITDGSLERFKVIASGSLAASLNLTASISAAAQVEGSCEKPLATIVVPFGGPLSLLIGARVPIGLKGSLGLAMQQNVATLTVAQDVQADMVLGVHYQRGQGFLPVNTLTVATTPGDTFINIPPSALRFRGKAFLGGTAGISLGVFGSGFSDALFALLDLSGGPQFEARFGEPYDVSTDPAYTAGYELKVVGKVGPGKDIVKAFEEIFGSLLQPSNLTLEFEQAWASSPRAGVELKADRAVFATGDQVTFRVDIDPATASFPFVGYNVSEVQVYFRDESSSTARRVARAQGAGKISFEVPWTADHDGRTIHPTSGRDNFFAFVVPVLLSTPSSSYPLELGPVRGVAPIEIIPREVILGTGSTKQFSARADGDDTTNVTWTATGGTISSTGFFRAGIIPGTYKVTVARADAPNVTDEATVEVRPHCVPGAGTGYCGFHYATQFLPGPFVWQSVGVNDNGDWVGVAEDGNGRRSVYTGRGNSFMLAPGLNPPLSNPWGLDITSYSPFLKLTNSNAFAGYAVPPSGVGVRGFVSQNGATRFLDPLPGGSGSVATDVSEDLIVVGHADDGVRARPVRWVNGVAEVLGPGLGDDARPVAISPDGKRILVTRGPHLANWIDVWHDGVITTLPNSIGCTGADINSHGDVIGECIDASDPAHPSFLGSFLWRNGAREQIEGAFAVNDSGDVLTRRPSLWRDGVEQDLVSSTYVSFPTGTIVHSTIYTSISRTKSILGAVNNSCASASVCHTNVFIGYPIALVVP
jgi:hypothetical protein